MDEKSSLMGLGEILQSLTSLSSRRSSLSDNEIDDRDIEDIRAERYNATAGDLDKSDGYSCSKCNNRGWIAVVIDGSMHLRQCKCLAARKSKRLLKSSGLESIIKRCTFDSYERRYSWQELAWNRARDYAAAPVGWIVISGRSGTGKTHLCTAICRELMLRGIPVRYMLWRDEISRIKFGESSDRREAIERLQRIDALYIDDFFKVGKGESPTTADVSLAFELLNYRYNDPALITIISTELTAADILSLDEAVGSRIYERTRGGNFIQFGSSAKNWRLIE